MNNEELEPATTEDLKKTMEYMDRPEVKEMWKRWDEEQVRIRRIYIDNPKRTAFFDYAEVLWYEVLERYGVMLKDEDMWDLINIWIEDYRRLEVLYDAVDEYAEGRGWEMK